MTALYSNPTVHILRSMIGSYNDWDKLSFTPDSGWQTCDLGTTRQEEFNHLTRYTFALPELEKYSHVYIRLYYRYGITLSVNEVTVFEDHIPSQILHPLFNPAEESACFTQHTYVK